MFDLNLVSEFPCYFHLSFFPSLAYNVLTLLSNQGGWWNQVGNDCLVVDGTDFRIAMGYQGFLFIQIQKKVARYEVALCIKTGDICWWSGPYAPGVWNDGSILFKDELIGYLEPGERVETDRGY